MSYNNFSDWYKKALINSETAIKQISLKTLNPEDVFVEIVKNSTWSIKEIFNLYWIDEKLVIEIINKGIINAIPSERKWVYSWMNGDLKDIILGSVKIAASYSKQRASLEDFLLSMLYNHSWLNALLDYVWIAPSDMKENLKEINKAWFIDGVWKYSDEKDETINSDSIDKLLWALTGSLMNAANSEKTTPFDNNKIPKQKKSESNTPALDFFSTDLTKEAREWKIDKIIGRDNEVERLIAILNRKTKNNPVLVWEPWVGKTAVAEWLAIKIAEWKVPFSMKDKKLLSLDMSSLVAWTKYRWEFEARIKQVIDEASKVENEIILFIDEIHTIIWAWGWEWTLDASNILKPAMWRWKIRVIWATTLNEYQKYIEKDSALERRFQKITTAEPDEETAYKILKWLKEVFEEYHNLNITDEATKAAIELSTRYITDRYLPDKAIDLIDEACSLKSMKYNYDEKEIVKLKEEIASLQKKIESAVISQQYKKASELKEKQASVEAKISEFKKKFKIPKEKRLGVDVKDIQKIINISTWIPLDNFSSSEIARLKKLWKDLKSEIIGQDEAIDWIVKSIMRSKAWIADTNRPLWSFLFLGPTWVGKTQLVKTLAEKFYEDKNALIKIDMSEYSDKTSVNKLIWSSAWYVWYEEGWMLTEKVRKKPYSIILFDEIEKWDFEVYNLLLQILEDWSLTDNKWIVVNFKNTIVIMTSNIGQEEFSNKAAQIWFDVTESEENKIMNDYAKAKENIVWNLTEYFSPEFVNRIDKIIVFNPLDKIVIRKIVKLKLEEFKKRLEKKSISLSYDLKIINKITKDVYNPEFWAREVRRYITDNIEDKIAEVIINDNSKNNFTIKVNKGELVID